LVTKEHLKEVENYIKNNDDHWVSLKPKMNEMMISYSEFYDIIKSLVDDKIIEPHPASNYGTLRITRHQELVVDPDLRFRIISPIRQPIPQNNHPKRNDWKSKFWNRVSKYWWYIIVPLLLFIAYKYIEWKWLNEIFK